MLIHVVQQGDTIESIAASYRIPETILTRDNGLESQEKLVIGQSLIISYPELTYRVKEGDSLLVIADTYQVPYMELLQNNPYLSDREYIYPGDIIVISYPKTGSITTHGNTVAYIDRKTLRKTLPYLTYLSVLNYTATNEGEIISYYDDTEIIQLAKDYDVIPLMLLTTLTLQGEANLEAAYDLILNEEFQEKQIENILTILKSKGYSGVNISFEYISISNLQFIENYYSKLAKRLTEEGFLVFAVINPNINTVGNEIRFAKVDFSLLGQLAQNIMFMNYEWATNTRPPSPISSLHNIDAYLEYLQKFISSDKLIIGLPTIGYDWELPFSTNISSIYTLALENALGLARNVGAVIQFDEASQTPYFRYSVSDYGNEIEHIVWFIDARSMYALLELVAKYELHGTGIWNISIYNPQLWVLINSQYEIEKIPIE